MNISRKVSSDDSVIYFLDETLKSEDCIKLLGVNITKTLDWSIHVDKLAKRAGFHLHT